MTHDTRPTAGPSRQTEAGPAIGAPAPGRPDTSRRPAPPAPQESAPNGVDPAVKRLAAILITGAMAVTFDSTIVNVALGTLARDLGTTVSTIGWVSTGYLLALAMVVPVTGWAQARLGGRTLWMAALGLFLAGSLGACLAWSPAALIGFRLVQGAGGGIMLPVMQNLLVRAAGGRNLGRTMATIGLPVVLGPILGPFLGGLIVTYLDWRWIFWVNIPFCVAGLYLAHRFLPREEPGTPGPLDAGGLALLAPGTAAVLFSLSQAGRLGSFTDPAVWGPLTGGLALVAAFTVRALHRGPRSLVDLRLLRIKSFAASSVVITACGFATYAAMILLPLYYQQVRGGTALAAGIALVPQGVGNLLTRSLAGRLTDRIGPRPVVLGGLVAVVAGTLPFAWAGATTPIWVLMVALLVRGAGLGGVTIPAMTSAYVGIPAERVPSASIITRTVQQIGGSFGTAVAAVVLEWSLVRAGSGSAAGASPAGVAGSFGTAFVWVIAFTAAACLPVFLLRRGPAGAGAGGTGKGRGAQSGGVKSGPAAGHDGPAAGHDAAHEAVTPPTVSAASASTVR